MGIFNKVLSLPSIYFKLLESQEMALKISKR